jgi:U3 small nucleolar RNA-associated protein 7
MSRYFIESELPKKENVSDNVKNEKKTEVYHVSTNALNKVKFKAHLRKLKSEGIDYDERKRKREKNDPFPGRKPVDQKKLRQHSRGQRVDFGSIQNRVKEKEVKRHEEILEFAAEQATRAEILLPEDAGYLQGDEDQEFTAQLTQTEIRKAVDTESAAKSFDLKLQEFGPYTVDYTRNGKYLLIGGRRGHLAAFDWTSKSLMCEVNAMESVHCVKWLHTESLFAVAQKKWTYVYDNQGIEIHCLKTMNNMIQLEYLPYHFLLAGSSESGNVMWLDVSIGKVVKDTWTRLGRLGVMCQNPTNAVICCGHSNGTVTMWTPNLKDPAAKLLAHGHGVRGITVDRTGTYMATSCVNGTVKIWDVRAFKCLHEYKMRHGASKIKFSQRNLLGVSSGNLVEIYKDATKGNITYPYMKHEVFKPVTEIHFCPYEDVMGIGHGAGFTSILVPGSGEPNFDALEANPYQTKKQKREAEVKMLLDKVSYELITIDGDALTGVDAQTLQDKIEESNKTLFMKPLDIKFDPRNKMKGKGGSAKRHYIRKKVEEQAKTAHLKMELAKDEVQREGEPKKPPKVYTNALDRFR